MSKSTRNRKLMAALSPVFNGISRLMNALLRSKPQCASSEAPASRWAGLESQEVRTMLSGGLVQPFQLPNATVSDAVYDSAGNLPVAFRDQSAHRLKYAMRPPGGAWYPIMDGDGAGSGGNHSI